jgi:hypothetical protein
MELGRWVGIRFIPHGEPSPSPYGEVLRRMSTDLKTNVHNSPKAEAEAIIDRRKTTRMVTVLIHLIGVRYEVSSMCCFQEEGDGEMDGATSSGKTSEIQ